MIDPVKKAKRLLLHFAVVNLHYETVQALPPTEPLPPDPVPPPDPSPSSPVPPAPVPLPPIIVSRAPHRGG